MSSVPLISFHTGNKIPQVGFGTACMEGEECINAVYNAVKAGYRHIDTAIMYKNQPEIATALEKLYKEGVVKREDIFITSKIPPNMQGKEKATEAVQIILDELKTNYVDLVLIHWPYDKEKGKESPENPERRLETWKVMEEARFLGKFKDIGVSNFTKQHLEHLFKNSSVKPVLNQFEIHPLVQDEEMIEACKSNNIVVEAYSSLAHNHKDLMENKTMEEVASKLGKSIAQVGLRWATQKGIVVIPKSRTEERIKSNIEIFSFEIPQEDMSKIDKLNKMFRTGESPYETKY